MDVFHVDENVKSYACPIVKIIVSVLLIVAFINRDRFIHIENKTINIAFGVLCIAVSIICIYCIYLSAYELTLVHENRTRQTELSNTIMENSKEYTVEEIISMAENNDIIEIRIASKSKIVAIGSSSDCKNGSSKFFDKLYYIENEMFESIADFESGLLSYSKDGKVLVISIDGTALG